ncbi:MAG: hypothetical protein RSC24_15745 [Clostridium sp.]
MILTINKRGGIIKISKILACILSIVFMSNVQQDYRFQDWFDLIYELQPNCVIFSQEGPNVRWIGNENGYAGETCWSTISRDEMRKLPDQPHYLNTGEENG